MPDTLTAATARPHCQPVVDGRPPAHSWPCPSPLPVNQPSLLGSGGDPEDDPSRQVVVLRNRWSAPTAAHLPDPGAWSVSLALAMLETLHGRRPVGQLSRWVDESVLGSITMHLRQRRSRAAESGRGRRPPVLHSIRIQCPRSEAVEVTAHLILARRSVAMAFRLEASGDRWLCTALEMGPGARQQARPGAAATTRQPLSRR